MELFQLLFQTPLLVMDLPALMEEMPMKLLLNLMLRKLPS
jgi:hypothetical protein